MAEDQDELVIDDKGYIKEGRFSGQHISTVARYAISLEEALKGDEPTPPQPPEKPKKDPNTVLVEHSKGRVDAATALTWQRLEADDEAEFSKTVPDYDKYREKINEMKKTVAPEKRIIRGLHKFLYATVRQEDPEVQKVIFGGAKPKEEPVPPKEGEETETPPVTAAETPKPVETPAPPGPKPAPPSATPTPASRVATPATRKPKLKPTEKVIKAARNWGMDLDEYLILLEDQGTTQEQLNAASVGAETRRRSTVYDRTVAR